MQWHCSFSVFARFQNPGFNKGNDILLCKKSSAINCQALEHDEYGIQAANYNNTIMSGKRLYSQKHFPSLSNSRKFEEKDAQTQKRYTGHLNKLRTPQFKSMHNDINPMIRNSRLTET